ncbi:N-acetylmuramoyl-L-alanine amidase [Nocardia higoensis]|uniref:N-acetylmuramoyl-L-alanine amidase n=1 Tax=Nocardia higoensis TaxID=228599 RepID=UPI002B4B7668|nr:N-acetylmuramoyl-L-alanine amidase [Nocardia higoensis]
MPYPKPKRSFVLPMVTTLAVAAPLAALTMSDSAEVRPANGSETVGVPAQLAQVVLNQAADITLPLRELSGLDLPDLRLSDLRELPRTATDLPVPGAAPDQAAAPKAIAAPGDLPEGITPDSPALAPGVLPQELLDQLGAQVKELSRETPFSMVALTAPDLSGTTAMIRARGADGGWGQWYPAEPVDAGAGAAAAAKPTSGTEPIYVGDTTSVQILVSRKPAAMDPQTPSSPERSGPVAPIAHPEFDPAQAIDDLTAILIDPGRGALDASLHEVAAALPGGGPNVITRSQWGADESINCQDPTYDDGLGGVTVHHTAGRNDYDRAESAGIVRAIYTYHSQTLGWCDIGYNALVDKYGQIFEGRRGGLDRPVQGAHAGGFNENTSGVALMGNHESVPPTEAAIQSIGSFIGWRTRVAGLDPLGHTTMWSEGTEFTPYARGEEVDLPIVFAHRDVGYTTCPGDAAYGMMDRIREIAAGTPGSSEPRRVGSDLAALAQLTARLLNMVNDNLIAKHYAATGGPAGPLGEAASEPMPAAQGQQYAKFVNGYVYTAPYGNAVEVAGAILDRFLAMGADSGILGLPLSSPYPVPEGLRSDFQNGSLILNQLTGIVTTVWKTYNDTLQEEMGRHPDAEPEGAPAPAEAPPADAAPAPADVPPADAPAAPADAAPTPADTVPTPADAVPTPAAPPAPEQDPAPAPAGAAPLPEGPLPESAPDSAVPVPGGDGPVPPTAGPTAVPSA